tara:strand:+ start:4142 stop:10579 length:6438 start_codon:yes stop_codon:yes gene_type:complete
MLPSTVATQIRQGLRRFLEASFPMTTTGFKRDDGRTMLDDFLAEDTNLFRGPYLSLGLPFRRAQADAAGLFQQLTLPFTPYQHQLLAFQRLTGAQPRSTLVATGTGSGKTECFFYPLLDHCATQKTKGIKAIIVYPMNALATDQARRFAKEVWGRAEIRGRVSVGLYVGDSQSSPCKSMQADSVITCKETLRAHPPDILLTNYKMLDFLLMRPKDQPLWRHNEPGTLRYLVVDELHTFDGAQGTDLACLIRRLRDRFSGGDALCCIGTSATIGGEEAGADLRDYAQQVFATDFDDDAVIREDRLSAEEFIGAEAPLRYTEWPARVARIRPDRYPSAADYLHAVAVAWFGSDQAPPLSSPDAETAVLARFALGAQLRACSAFRELLAKAGQLIEVPVLLEEWQQRLRQPSETVAGMLDSLLALVAAARTPANGALGDATARAEPFVNVRNQLWLRELTRMVSSVEAMPQLRFHDELTDPMRGLHLPTIHCRECHATGWVTVKQAAESRLESDVQIIYRAYFAGHPDSTLLFPREGDGARAAAGVSCQVCPRCAQLVAGSGGDCPACDGKVQRLPVWMPDMTRTHQTRDATQLRTHHDCPYCGANEGLSLIGSRAASLSSVMIGELFASLHNDHQKLIAFSDSVQDAAHRAGFFAARTFGTSVRMAIAQFLQQRGDGMSLPDVASEVARYWQQQCGDPGRFVGTFIAPNMDWLRDYAALRSAGQLPAGSDLPDLVAKRLSWEVMQGFGLRARIGRTLERSMAAAVGIESSLLEAAAKRLCERLSEEIGPLRGVPYDRVRRYLLGLLWRMRVQGGFFHPFWEPYIRARGATFELTRSPFLPNYGKASRPPSFMTMDKVSNNFERLDREGSSWYFAWFNKVLATDAAVLATAEYRQTMTLVLRELTRCGVLMEKSAGNDAVWCLDPAQWLCTTQVAALACTHCSHRIQVPAEQQSAWQQQPCLRASCQGEYAVVPARSTAYTQGRITRLTAAEHTGLLDGDTRHEVEQSFIHGDQPWDVNLLSATPTLEMGIDIGDLSAVLLCSVPPSQSNYQQRIGRAGRRDGNALTLTVANGHHHDLYFYADPKAMIAGAVRTPGVFLSATAVLERQLIAYCMDRWAASGIAAQAIPATVRDVLQQLEGGSAEGFPANLLAFVATQRNAIFRDFLAMFPALSEESQAHLRDFLFDGPNNLGYRLSNRLHQLLAERNGYSERIDRLLRRKNELEALPEDDHTRAELDEVLAERGAMMSLRRQINGTPTLNFFTDEGLLPNYAFPEEGVTLQSIIIRRRSVQQRAEGGDDDGKGYEKLNFQMQRPAQSALSELAPANRFYAVGRQVEIDQVDLKLSTVQSWRLCDRCHYVENLDESGDPHSVCPRCGSPQWSDGGRRRQMLRLRQVYATADDRSSRIGDDSDQRAPVFFNRQMLVDVPVDAKRKAYRLQSEMLPFGFEYIPKLLLREINFGQPQGPHEPMSVAGENLPRPGFQLCRHCGKVRRRSGRTRPGFEHAYDCKLRKPGTAENESDYFESLYLFRELSSEAVRILLPLSEVGSSGQRLHSLIAALNLGIRRYFRGSVDHIQATYYSEPDGGGSSRRHYVVLYDSVPGGTGYLKELLRRPENLLELLRRAHAVLSACPCAEDPERDGCYQCILAYRESRRMEEISRRAAEELLKRILEAADTLEEVEGLAAIDLNTLLESELEQRFVEVLANASPGLSFTPDVVNGKPGAFLSIALSAGDGRSASAWKLEPQVKLGPSEGVAVTCKPDFVLWPQRSGQNARPVAVFVDGFQYHYNALKDDTLKRQAVIDSGRFRVWSLGWHDLPVSGQKLLNPAAELLVRNQVEAMAALFDHVAAVRGWRRNREFGGLLAQGPFAWLLAYLQYGEDSAAELMPAAVSRVLGWLGPASVQDAGLRDHILAEVREWMPPAVQEALNNGDAENRQVLGGVLAALGETGAVRVLGALPLSALAAARAGDFDPLLRELAVSLSIDDEAPVADKNFEAEWLRFWGAANLLQFIPRFAIASRSGLHDGVYTALRDTWKAPASANDIEERLADDSESLAWNEVIELSFQAEDGIIRLRDAGVPLPQVGLELCNDTGEVVAEADLAWPDHQVAVVPEDSADEAAMLALLGWTVHLGLSEITVAAIREQTGAARE